MRRHAATILVLLLAACHAPAAEPAGTVAWGAGIWPQQRLGRTPSVPAGKWGRKWGSIEYGHNVEHCAFTAEEL